jgi:hypothetical protein
MNSSFSIEVKSKVTKQSNKQSRYGKNCKLYSLLVVSIIVLSGVGVCGFVYTNYTGQIHQPELTAHECCSRDYQYQDEVCIDPVTHKAYNSYSTIVYYGNMISSIDCLSVSLLLIAFAFLTLLCTGGMSMPAGVIIILSIIMSLVSFVFAMSTIFDGFGRECSTDQTPFDLLMEHATGMMVIEIIIVIALAITYSILGCICSTD